MKYSKLENNEQGIPGRAVRDQLKRQIAAGSNYKARARAQLASKDIEDIVQAELTPGHT